MAWYRAGGGGIPSSLKTGMNSVLNKKFGTSTTYDPAGWPDDVNLLGKLPERTASGSIAHITDGADEVPLKSWKVEIAPTLTGKSAIECTQTGKNLLEIKNKTAVGLTGSINSDGEYVISGIATSTVYFDFYGGTANGITLDAGKYTFSIDGLQTGVTATWTRNGAWAGSISSSTTINLTAQAMISGYIVVANGTDLSTPIKLKCMLERGDTASTFEPYSGTTSNVNLGRTIYGGTADVVNGTGTETHDKISDFSTLRSNGTSSTGAYRYIIDVSGMGDYNVGACVSNLLNYRVSYNANVGEFYNTTNVLIIFLAQDNAQDAITYLQSNSCEIAYPLATPTDFSFTPITPTPETALGVNNFWADSGDTEVTYRADIDLLLGGN